MGLSKREGFITMNLTFPHRKGELYRAMHSNLHRWVYFPNMTAGECIVFKVFDSAVDGRARLCLHSAFVDPTSPADAPARESIEFRTVVFFGDLPADFASNFVAPHLEIGSADQALEAPVEISLGPMSDEW